MITVATVGTGCQAEDRRTGVGVRGGGGGGGAGELWTSSVT